MLEDEKSTDDEHAQCFLKMQKLRKMKFNILLEKYDTKEIYTSTRFTYKNGKVELFLHDFGENVKKIFGCNEYEGWYKLNENDSMKLIEHLELEEKTEKEAEKILKDLLCREENSGLQSSADNFIKLCESLNLKTNYNQWISGGSDREYLSNEVSK